MFIDLYLVGRTTHRINVNHIRKIVMGLEISGTGAYYKVFLSNDEVIELSSRSGEIEVWIGGRKEAISQNSAEAFMKRLEQLD